ncbi:MAG TPA: TIM barrel protein [Chloroflexota bacterium]
MTGQTAIANAPVTFGAFEITVGRDPNVPDSLSVLDAIQHAGYAGTDLGPPGYFGTPSELAGRLRERGLGLAGGFVEFPLSQPEGMDAALSHLDRTLDIFDAVREQVAAPYPPRPTIADTGSAERQAHPGQSHLRHELGLDDAGWRTLQEQVHRVVERCRQRGYEPTFHPETGTYIEAPWEIEKLLELTDIGLCLDTGHLTLGGGDPVAAVREWGSRINHIHIKDARLQIIRQIVDNGGSAEDVWRKRAFCQFGHGDVDIDGVLSGLKEMSYAGWIVVEQDRLPEATEPVTQIEQEQAANLRFLTERGF